jgi:hypothetical protein
MADVPQDVGEAFICANRDQDWLKKVRAPGTKKYGKYYGAAFRLILDHDDMGEVVYLLWAKEHKYWKIVSFEVDPPEDGEVVPDADPDRYEVEEIPEVYTSGDPRQIQANKEFLVNWLVKEDYDSAFNSVAPECYACVFLYNEEEKIPSGKIAQFFKTRLQQTGDLVPRGNQLSEIIENVDLDHPDFKTVPHPHEDAFAIISIPDYYGEQIDCETEPADDYFPSDAEPRVYGNYYITALQMNVPGMDQGVLFLLWAKRNGEWKIIAYRIESP